MRILSLVILVVLCENSATWAGDGVVALQSADPSCRTTTTPPPIYVDCGNGTVTDNRTGLVWLENADCIGTVVWFSAMEFVAGLSDLPGPGSDPDDCGLSDGSSPGEWRLASKAEWQAMIADGTACTPRITNDIGDGCWSDGPSTFLNVKNAFYWSSTTSASNTANAWDMTLSTGAVFTNAKTLSLYVWPVHGGQ